MLSSASSPSSPTRVSIADFTVIRQSTLGWSRDLDPDWVERGALIGAVATADGERALVAFGPGGVFAELIGDVGFRIAPVTDVDAEELVTTGKAGKLVQGFRGAPAADVASLVDLVCRLARVGEDHPAVAELDLNPVLAFPDRCIAVDARVRVQRPEGRPRVKSW